MVPSIIGDAFLVEAYEMTIRTKKSFEGSSSLDQRLRGTLEPSV